MKNATIELKEERKRKQNNNKLHSQNSRKEPGMRVAGREGRYPNDQRKNPPSSAAQKNRRDLEWRETKLKTQ